MTKLPTIKIKGKDYITVATRVAHFNQEYQNGRIKTTLLTPPDSNMVIIKAEITPDVDKPTRYFTGLSQAKWDDTHSPVNKAAAIENCETSAVGRALGFMGIGSTEDIRSADEMNKASYTDSCNMYQLDEINKLIKELGVQDKTEGYLEKAKVKKLEELPKFRAQYLLDQLRIKRDEEKEIK